MKKITCRCEQTFNVDFKEKIDLTKNPEFIDQILEGVFLSYICPACNAEINTEFPVLFDWSSKNVEISFIPEVDRFSWLESKPICDTNRQTVIGYPELADRVAVLNENLNPLVIETIKYYLIEKALENNENENITIIFEKIIDDDNLEFRIHGLKQNEVAISLIPKTVYDTITNAIINDSNNELYTGLVNNSYISVQNLLFEE